jgi:hypothetical protein
MKLPRTDCCRAPAAPLLGGYIPPPPPATAGGRASIRGRSKIGCRRVTSRIGVTFRIRLLCAAALLLCGCTGPVDEVTTIPQEEAAWRAIAPRLPGMPVAAVEQCAGPPRGVAPAPAGGAALVYRAQDLKNYCQVSLLAQGGRVLSFTADYAAPEFLYLRDGSNYCGRIFRQCLR